MNFFIFTSLFLACCATGMVYLTYLIFDLPVNPYFLGFTFGGTICSYNFHWFLTPHSYSGTGKAHWSIRHKKLHLTLCVTGLAVAALCAPHLLRHWHWLLATAFLTFLYSAPMIPHAAAKWLQKIAIGKTLFLSFAWTHITALLPMVLHHALLSDAEIIYVIQRFFLIYSICILFDYRDREQDLRSGVRSVITAFKPAGVHRFFWGNIIAFVLASITLAWFGFSAQVIIALAIPGLLVALISNYSLKHPGDYIFYGVLDGLMALSLPLLLLLQIFSW